MQDFSNFLNNFRTNAAKWEADLNRSANQALNQIGQSANQAFQTGTAPFRYLGGAINNAVTTTGNNIANGLNTLANNVANKLPLTSGTAAMASAPRTVQTAQAQPSSNAYKKDAGIDTFISFLRTVMNPLRGITGDTPLDAVVNSVSDTLYNSFGQKADSDNGKESTSPTPTPTYTVAQEAVSSIDGSGITAAPKASEATLASNTNDNATDTITYTYKPGDTFGQVLLDLGLQTDRGLWGENGDVRYYTQQLIDQGALDRNGNIPIGTTIKLRRRK